MAELFRDPTALVPQDLDEAMSRRYEELTVEELRSALLVETEGPVIFDAIDVVGSRPDTLVVFRYHHRPEYIGKAQGLDPGPRAEIARLWDYAIEEGERWMDGPSVLAAAIGSDFDAARLTLADPDDLTPGGSPPRVFPRY